MNSNYHLRTIDPTVLVWALILVVVGCGPATQSNVAFNPPKPEAKPSLPAQRSEVTVAAASDLKFAFEELLVTFQQSHPNIDVKVTFGSSGNFYAQLSNRAPFDLYLSADIDYPRKLIEQGLADRTSEFTYAFGHVVVWVPKVSPLDVEQKGIEILLDPSAGKIAIANPKHAPYGRAAQAAMKSLGVYEQVEDRLVLGENIAQTAQFVETGAASVGLVALSLAMAPTLREKGRFWQIPESACPPLEQGGVILSWAKDREAADALRSFLLSESGRSILRKFGFTVPKDERKE